MKPRAWCDQNGTPLIRPYRPGLRNPSTGAGWQGKQLPGPADGVRWYFWVLLAAVLAVLFFGPGLVGA